MHIMKTYRVINSTWYKVLRDGEGHTYQIIHTDTHVFRKSTPVGLAIGINFGTTFYSVGVLRSGKFETIANAQGCRKTPTCVAFMDKEHLIGETSKIQAAMNPANAVDDVKRPTRRCFNDEVVQGDRKRWTFVIISKEEIGGSSNVLW